MSNADNSVAMVAVAKHPGYNYDGIPYQIVSVGQKFNVTPARAARLLAKGVAALDVAVPEPEPVVIPEPEVEPEPKKIDKRTKAYKASKG
jgi:hypothetical protein